MFVASARKYRPQKWADVLDQPATVRILQNAIRQDRIASAYLLSGQKGCGKTSIARLLAKTLNCFDLSRQLQDGVVLEPCGYCPSCVGIAEGRDPEVLELDAASNRGVDDARALQSVAQQCPRSGAWRIVILDECHMLTKEAQNALLALLETPPSRFLPIFCTTDTEKILPTIKSRCSQFQIRPLSQVAIAGSLKRIFSEAGRSVTDDVLFALARLGNGSLRDVQQIADQLVICSDVDQVIDDELVASQAGVPTVSLFREIVGALSVAWVEGPATWFQCVEDLHMSGVDLHMVYFQILPTLLRDLRIAIVSAAYSEPVAPYESGIAHSVFLQRNRFTHLDLDLLFSAWESMTAYFSTLTERSNIEFFFLKAWDARRHYPA